MKSFKRSSKMKSSIKTRLIAIVVMMAMLLCAVPAGATPVKAGGELKVLFIGNSFSDDATDSGYFDDSTLYAMLENMLGEGKVGVGLVWHGGKTMAWHASMAKNDFKEYSFFYTDSRDGWDYVGPGSTAEALAYTDWDVVVLQPYGQELTEGYCSIEGVLSEFKTLEASLPYMLDHVAKNAPDAEVYLHLPWSVTTELKLNAANDDYKTIAGTIRKVEAYTGTESGKAITGVLPIGAAVQAARNTYLATLDYNAEAIAANDVQPETDPQMGLQRDGVHLSFEIGRYLANMVVAETLVPEDARLKGYTLPEMRESEKVGKLPSDYADILRVAADAAYAAASGAGNSKYVIRKLTGYEKSPIASLEDTLGGTVTAGVTASATAADAEASIAAAVVRAMGADATATAKLKGDFTVPSAGGKTEVSAEVTVKHGYESKTVTVNAVIKLGYKVEVTVEGNGSASDVGTVIVPEGEDFTVSFNPANGYAVSDIKVDGVSVGAADSYTLSAVADDHTVEVTFMQDNPFVDVEQGKWYYAGVMYVYSMGYMKGTNAALTEFSPSMEFTREQFVQLLFNIEGLSKEDYAGDTGFDDVPAGKWYSPAVKWAKEAGVTEGVGGGKFGLGGKVSREQLAKFLMNYAELKKLNTDARADLSGFSDNGKISKWAKDAASWAVAEGFIGSTDKNTPTLAPGKVATRAEIAKITMGYAEYLGK